MLQAKALPFGAGDGDFDRQGFWLAEGSLCGVLATWLGHVSLIVLGSADDARMTGSFCCVLPRLRV
jgi:hypothetical protein